MAMAGVQSKASKWIQGVQMSTSPRELGCQAVEVEVESAEVLGW